MKSYKWLIMAIAFVVAIAAVVTAIALFKEEIIDTIIRVKDKVKSKTPLFSNDELNDFADV